MANMVEPTLKKNGSSSPKQDPLIIFELSRTQHQKKKTKTTKNTPSGFRSNIYKNKKTSRDTIRQSQKNS